MDRTALAVALLLSAGSTAAAQQPALLAQPSTRATTVVSLTPPRGAEGLTPARISVDYGQPHLRGRTLHEDNLVPLDSVWRFGANTSTTLETGVDLMIGNHAVPAGKYSLYALPAVSGWKLIINRNTGQWGTQYSAEHDLARVDLIETALAAPMASFTVWLIPTSPQNGKASGELRFAWGGRQQSTTWLVR